MTQMSTPTPPPPTAPRFYCAALPAPRLHEAEAVLDADQARHARKVLRLTPGTPVELIDGQGGLAPAVIDRYEGPHAVCRVRDVMRFERPAPEVTIVAAVPKGPRAEMMVEQLSQLGVDRLIPVRSARSVVDPRAGKLEKFARQAVESCKQCGRLWSMEVWPTADLEEVLRGTEGLKLVAHPATGSAGAGLPAVVERVRKAEAVTVLIGPEGGFTDQEVDRAEAADFERWRIAPHVLRIETAAATAAALLRYAGAGVGGQ